MTDNCYIPVWYVTIDNKCNIIVASYVLTFGIFVEWLTGPIYYITIDEPFVEKIV